MICKIDYSNVTCDALDTVRVFEEDELNGYSVEDIMDLNKYSNKITKRINNIEKYGIDWYDAYKLKKLTKKMRELFAKSVWAQVCRYLRFCCKIVQQKHPQEW